MHKSSSKQSLHRLDLSDSCQSDLEDIKNSLASSAESNELSSFANATPLLGLIDIGDRSQVGDSKNLYVTQSLPSSPSKFSQPSADISAISVKRRVASIESLNFVSSVQLTMTYKKEIEKLVASRKGHKGWVKRYLDKMEKAKTASKLDLVLFKGFEHSVLGQISKIEDIEVQISQIYDDNGVNLENLERRMVMKLVTLLLTLMRSWQLIRKQQRHPLMRHQTIPLLMVIKI